MNALSVESSIPSKFGSVDLIQLNTSSRNCDLSLGDICALGMEIPARFVKAAMVSSSMSSGFGLWFRSHFKASSVARFFCRGVHLLFGSSCLEALRRAVNVSSSMSSVSTVLWRNQSRASFIKDKFVVGARFAFGTATPAIFAKASIWKSSRPARSIGVRLFNQSTVSEMAFDFSSGDFLAFISGKPARLRNALRVGSSMLEKSRSSTLVLLSRSQSNPCATNLAFVSCSLGNLRAL